MAPGQRKRSLTINESSQNIPSQQDNSHTLDVGSSVGSPSSTARGPTRSLKTSNLVKTKGPITITISPVTGEQEGPYCSRLVSECGVIVRTIATQQVASYAKIPWEDRMQLFRQLLQFFILDLTQPHVLKYLDRIMGERYRDYRSKVLRKVYKAHPPQEAKRHCPKNVSQEDWDYLCDFWGNENIEKICSQNAENRSKLPFNHRGGSKPFFAHRKDHSESDNFGEVQSFPDHFRATHYNERHGWISLEAQYAHEKMVEIQQRSHDEGSEPISDEQMSRQVFGDNSRYIKGLAKRRRVTEIDRGSSSTDTNLRTELEATRLELQETRSQLATQKATLDRVQVILARLAPDLYESSEF